MAELADALDLKSSSERSVGSSPTGATLHKYNVANIIKYQILGYHRDLIDCDNQEFIWGCSILVLLHAPSKPEKRVRFPLSPRNKKLV